MALLAIIHIPDDHTADGLMSRDIEWPNGTRLVGVFNYPHYRKDLTCRGNCVTGHSGAWTRDPRGFMKCAVCGSRNRKLRSWLIGHLFDLLGANLYPDAPAAFRTPDGYGFHATD